MFIYMTGGQAALALRLFLALFSSKISSDVNRPFGDEVMEWKLAFKGTIWLLNWSQFVNLSYDLQFRAARKVSEEVGAQIVLGDRPIEITVCA